MRKFGIFSTLKQSSVVHQGDGFSNHNVVNNAIGFFKNGEYHAKAYVNNLNILGKLYLLPVQDVYDMQHQISSAKPAENGKGNLSTFYSNNLNQSIRRYCCAT